MDTDLLMLTDADLVERWRRVKAQAENLSLPPNCPITYRDLYEEAWALRQFIGQARGKHG